MTHSALYLWLAPREDSKKRKVLDRFLAARGGWVRGSELHEAFGVYGWAWDGAVAQLRECLRARGGDIESEKIEGRDEFRYRLVLPPNPQFEQALKRSEAVVAGMRRNHERVSATTPSTSSDTLAGDPQGRGTGGDGERATPTEHPSPGPETNSEMARRVASRSSSPSRRKPLVGRSGAARAPAGAQGRLL